MTTLKLSTKTRKDDAYVVYTTPDGASVYFPARAVVGTPPAEVTVSLGFGPIVRKAPKFETKDEKIARLKRELSALEPVVEQKQTGKK